jgi:hypothetical protein
MDKVAIDKLVHLCLYECLCTTRLPLTCPALLKNFQVLKRELVLKSEKKDDWKEDFRKISVWEEDNFDQIREEFSNWKIEKF